MTTATAAICAALGFGLIALFALLPAARLIPKRLDEQWAREIEAERSGGADWRVTDYTYTTTQKAGFCAGAMALGAFVVWTYGTATLPAGAYAFYFLGLLLLVAVNLKHALLPDVVVLASLWVGLLFHAWLGDAQVAIYGAAAGYLVPFTLVTLFKMRTSHQTMGGGDLKAFAMAGAWFGIPALPLLFVAFIAGCIAWQVLSRVLGSKGPQRLVPTGPAHLAASLVVASGWSLPF